MVSQRMKPRSWSVVTSCDRGDIERLRVAAVHRVAGAQEPAVQLLRRHAHSGTSRVPQHLAKFRRQPRSWTPGEQSSSENRRPLADPPEEQQKEGRRVSGEVTVDPTTALLSHRGRAIVDLHEHAAGAADGDLVARIEPARTLLVDEGPRVESPQKGKDEAHQRQPGVGWLDGPSNVLCSRDVISVHQRLAEHVAGEGDAWHRDALDEPR